MHKSYLLELKFISSTKIRRAGLVRSPNLSVRGKIFRCGFPATESQATFRLGEPYFDKLDTAQETGDTDASHDQIPKTDRYCSINIISRF